MIDSRHLYVANALVDAVVDKGGVVRIAGESRGNGRSSVFGYPTVIRDATGQPTDVNYSLKRWLVDDAVVGVLPVVAHSQLAAQVFADYFAAASRHDVVASVPGQVRNWCQWWCDQPDHDTEMLPERFLERDGLFLHGVGQALDAEPAPAEASAQVEDVWPPDPETANDPETLADDVLAQAEEVLDQAELPAEVNEAPALTHTYTEVVN